MVARNASCSTGSDVAGASCSARSPTTILGRPGSAQDSSPATRVICCTTEGSSKPYRSGSASTKVRATRSARAARSPTDSTNTSEFGANSITMSSEPMSAHVRLRLTMSLSESRYSKHASRRTFGRRAITCATASLPRAPRARKKIFASLVTASAPSARRRQSIASESQSSACGSTIAYRRIGPANVARTYADAELRSASLGPLSGGPRRHLHARPDVAELFGARLEEPAVGQFLARTQGFEVRPPGPTLEVAVVEERVRLEGGRLVDGLDLVSSDPTEVAQRRRFRDVTHRNVEVPASSMGGRHLDLEATGLGIDARGLRKHALRVAPVGLREQVELRHRFAGPEQRARQIGAPIAAHQQSDHQMVRRCRPEVDGAAQPQGRPRLRPLEQRQPRVAPCVAMQRTDDREAVDTQSPALVMDNRPVAKLGMRPRQHHRIGDERAVILDLEPRAAEELGPVVPLGRQGHVQRPASPESLASRGEDVDLEERMSPGDAGRLEVLSPGRLAELGEPSSVRPQRHGLRDARAVRRDDPADDVAVVHALEVTFRPGVG